MAVLVSMPACFIVTGILAVFYVSTGVRPPAIVVIVMYLGAFYLGIRIAIRVSYR